MEKIILKGRLDGKQRHKLKRLFDMFYTPGELAKEIGFNPNQILRVYIPAGCPHEIDDKKQTWINGKLFYGWYDTIYPRISLGENEAFCMTCKKSVCLNDPLKEACGRTSYWICYCPECNRKLTRIISKEKRQE